MPFLKDLHCFIELDNGKNQLREFGTTYGDGCVETFVAVPKQPQSFAIRLSSSKFIAPGLAMYVFIDGVYQCNRNRQNLKLRKPLDRKSLVDFVVRQKEESQEDGTMIARDWNFEKLDIVSADEAPEVCSAKVLENLGCIEVVVLRCAGMRSVKSAKVNAKGMNMDGAGDIPDHYFGLDGAPSPNIPERDDRAWEYIRGRSRSGAPTISSSRIHSGPPPPLSSQSYGARPRQTSPASQNSFPPHGYPRSSDRIAGSIRYGRGPVPHQTRTASMHGPAPSIQDASASHMPFDLGYLDQALTKMAEKSSDRYYQASSQSPAISLGAPNAPPSHIPGSWPEPDRSPASAFAPVVQDHEGPTYLSPVAAPGLQPDLQGTQSSWYQHFPEPERSGWDHANGWESGEEEEKNSAIWDSGDTWGTPRQGNTRDTFESERAREQAPTGWDGFVTDTTRTDPWTRSSDFQTAQSGPTVIAPEADTDGEGWTHVEAISDSSGSWFQPVQPSESISRVAGPSVVASAVDQGPLVDALTKKLLSLNNDEKSQRRSVATGPAASLAQSVPFPEEGFSTFEKSVREALDSGKPGSVWKVSSSELAPKPWPALERKIMSEDLGRESSFANHRYGTVHDYKHRGEPSTDIRPNRWAEENIVRSIIDRPSLLHDDMLMSKDDWTKEKDHGDAIKGTSWDIQSRHKDLQNSDTSWQADINGWSAPQKAESLVNETNPWITTKEAESRPAKTRLAKYRQLRAPATAGVAVKGTRQFPPPTPDAKLGSRPKKVDEMDAEPLTKVTKEDAANKGVEHQVRAGKGSKYGHAIGRPEYLDNLEKPYAVFRFKYRAHGTLRKILGRDIVPSDSSLLVTSPIDRLAPVPLTTATKVGDFKQQLQKVPKDVLIDGLMDLQSKLEKKTKGAGVAAVDTAGFDRTRDWVKQQSRPTSMHGKKESRKGEESWGSGDGWN